MKVTVLMDNQTEIDRYFLGEPAVAYWIETQGKGFLFDTAYSEAFLQNAEQLGIQVTTADWVILSHGHNDHTGGLSYLLEQVKEEPMKLLCHPDVFPEKQYGEMAIGCPLSLEQVETKAMIATTKEPYWLTESLVFLGEIPRIHPFEPLHAIGTRAEGKPDFVLEDSALAYVGEDGLYIITGCSHAGICNIISYAKEVTACEKVSGVLGGFHLFDLDEKSQAAIDFLTKEDIAHLYPCHCTSFVVRAALHQKTKVQEVGVGLELQWN